MSGSPAPGDRGGRLPAPAVLGWGTAKPEHAYDQAEVAAHLSRHLDRPRTRRLLAAFRGSRVVQRNSVLPDFAPDAEPLLFGAETPSTAERLEVFRRFAPELALRAARGALEAAAIDPQSLTHLIYVTCTGFAAPGPDQELVESLDLPLTVQRIQIGFQGCSAGLVALRTAAEIVRGNESARVLIASVELSSLHFQADLEEEDLRGHALFADGAGAAVVGRPDPARGEDRTLFLLDRGHSLLVPVAKDEMTWRIGDTGFRMRLTSQVPEALSAALPDFVDRFHRGVAGGRKAIRHWGIHPGGPVILDRVAEALDLPQESLEASREVLRQCGNMSSATIFFVLERIARTGSPGPGVALAFGPGLSADGLAFRLAASG